MHPTATATATAALHRVLAAAATPGPHGWTRRLHGGWVNSDHNGHFYAPGATAAIVAVLVIATFVSAILVARRRPSS